MEQRRKEETAADYDSLRRGWYLGSEQFRRDPRAEAVEQVRENDCGADRQETGEQKAERLLREEFQRLARKEKGLPLQDKADRSKVALARRLRQETTMSLKCIARRLEMGSWTYVADLLHEK